MSKFEEEIKLCKVQIIIWRKSVAPSSGLRFPWFENRLENKSPVTVFLSNSSSFTAFVIKSGFVELSLCYLLGGSLFCHLTFRIRMGNHELQVLSLLLICCGLGTSHV